MSWTKPFNPYLYNKHNDIGINTTSEVWNQYGWKVIFIKECYKYDYIVEKYKNQGNGTSTGRGHLIKYKIDAEHYNTWIYEPDKPLEVFYRKNKCTADYLMRTNKNLDLICMVKMDDVKTSPVETRFNKQYKKDEQVFVVGHDKLIIYQKENSKWLKI